MMLLGSGALSEPGLIAAGRIAQSGVRVFIDTFVARQPRGAGRFAPERMPYFGEAALANLQGIDLMILVATKTPVAFFAYPGAPSVLVPTGMSRGDARAAGGGWRVLPASPGGRPRRRRTDRPSRSSSAAERRFRRVR